MYFTSTSTPQSSTEGRQGRNSSSNLFLFPSRSRERIHSILFSLLLLVWEPRPGTNSSGVGGSREREHRETGNTAGGQHERRSQRLTAGNPLPPSNVRQCHQTVNPSGNKSVVYLGTLESNSVQTSLLACPQSELYQPPGHFLT